MTTFAICAGSIFICLSLYERGRRKGITETRAMMEPLIDRIIEAIEKRGAA